MNRHTIEPAVGNQSTRQNRTSSITAVSTINKLRGRLYWLALCISVINIPSSQLVSISGVEVATVILVVVVQTVVHIPVGPQWSWDSEVDLQRSSKTTKFNVATYTY